MKELKTVAVSAERTNMYDLISRQTQRIGSKYFCYIPTSMLFVDESYQRMDMVKVEKINRLASNFNEDQMDALKVSARDDIKMFAIIDGCHRFEAAKRNDINYLECEILFNQSVADEAKLFAKQNEYVEALTPGQKHKANVLLGVRECIELEDTCKLYNISMKNAAKRGRQPVGMIQSYTDALRISKEYGREGLEWVFSICRDSMYTSEAGGLSSYVLGALRYIYTYHFIYDDDMKECIVKFLRENPPRIAKAKALAEYPMREPRIALALLLEDIAASEMKIAKVLHENIS